MVGKVREGAGDRLAACQVFRLEVRAVGSEDELRLGLGGGGAVLERFERLRHRACVAGQDVDVAGLENAAEVGPVRRPRTKALDRRILVAEGFKEGIGEVRRRSTLSAPSNVSRGIRRGHSALFSAMYSRMNCRRVCAVGRSGEGVVVVGHNGSCLLALLSCSPGVANNTGRSKLERMYDIA
jgi:hypothetical protein